MNHPTQNADDLAAGPPGLGAALGRVILFGGTVVGVLCAAALLSGLLPLESHDPVWWGAVAAYSLGVPGAAMKLAALRSTARPGRDGVEDGRRSATRLQAAVLGDFLLNLFAVGGGMFGLSLSGSKFPQLAGFGLAFASAALSMQVVAGLVLARFSRRLPTPAGPAGSVSQQPLGPAAKTPDAKHVAGPAGGASDPLRDPVAALLRGADEDPEPGSARR